MKESSMRFHSTHISSNLIHVNSAERGYYDLLEFLISNGARVRFTDLKKQSVSWPHSNDTPKTGAIQ